MIPDNYRTELEIALHSLVNPLNALVTIFNDLDEDGSVQTIDAENYTLETDKINDIGSELTNVNSHMDRLLIGFYNLSPIISSDNFDPLVGAVVAIDNLMTALGAKTAAVSEFEENARQSADAAGVSVQSAESHKTKAEASATTTKTQLEEVQGYAIEIEKNIPMAVSEVSRVRWVSQVIPSDTKIVKGMAIVKGSILKKMARAMPPKAECARPLPRKLKPR